MSIDRALGFAGLTATLIGTGLVFLWPAARWPGWIFLGLGLVLLLSLIVRWLMGLEKEQVPQLPVASQTLSQSGIRIENNPHNVNKNVNVNTFKPTIEVKIDNKQSQRQSSYRSPQIIAPSRFTADARIVGFLFNTETKELDHEGYRGPIDESGIWIPVKVALVRFYYQPDAGVYPFLDVVAHIEAINVDDRSAAPMRLHRTVWRNSPVRDVRFHTADDHELIIAVFVPVEITNDRTSIILWEFHEQPNELGYGTFVTPLGRTYSGTSFLINIQLVGKWTDDSVQYNQSFQVPLDLFTNRDEIGDVRLLSD